MQDLKWFSFIAIFRTEMSLYYDVRGDSTSLGLITQLVLTECNRTRFASLKFPFVLILTGTMVAL